jgi:accessory gene regulator protein AgrB
MNVTFLEGLRNLVVGLFEILLEKVKFLGVAIIVTLFMTFFVVTWAGIALLLGVELNEVTGSIPYKGYRSMDYGSPAIWTISCIISAGISILIFFGIKSIFRRIRSKKSKPSVLLNNPEKRNGRPTD